MDESLLIAMKEVMEPPSDTELSATVISDLNHDDNHTAIDSTKNSNEEALMQLNDENKNEDIETSLGGGTTVAGDILLNNANIGTNTTNLDSHVTDSNNPHQVTSLQIGLENVDNTSDLDKPISNDTQSAIDSTNGEVSNNTTNITDNSNNIQTNNTNISNHVGDSNNPHGVTSSQLGLENVDNTSDLDKPISNDTQTALDDKVAIATNPSKTVKGAIKAFYDATTSTLEISIDGVDIP